MNKEQAVTFFDKVMAGENIEAQGIFKKVKAALDDNSDSKPIRVPLTDDEAFFLWDDQRDMAVDAWVRAFTEGKRMIIAHYPPYNASLHIEEENNLCSECKTLPGITS